MEITSINSFLDYYENIHKRTRRAVDHIPPDRLEWTYRQGKFTIGDLVRHLAAINRFMFAENAVGRPSVYPGHGPDLAEGYEAVVDYFERMHAETIDTLGELTDDDLNNKITTPAGVSMTCWKWLRAMVEHEIHHRGQIYIYLGLLEVGLPPLYGLTSEEVRARSTPV